MTSKMYALSENIGDPDFFVGRRQEMDDLLRWAEAAKALISKSTVVLSRPRMGKTALLQRFFNILYTHHDPQLIPVYWQIPVEHFSQDTLASLLYQKILAQYLAFTTQTPNLITRYLTFAELKKLAIGDPNVAADIFSMERTLQESPDLAWAHACGFGHRISQLNDVRILQIVDDFHLVNRWTFVSSNIRDSLVDSYMAMAESRCSPHIVSSTYLGWLEAVQGKAGGRYTERHLGNFTDEEAAEAVSTWAAAYEVDVTDTTAPYIAEVCHNNPFYINAILNDHIYERELSTVEAVRAALEFDATADKGAIQQFCYRCFFEVTDRISAVNGVDARRIVLYIAAFDSAERTRDQIRRDLKLTVTDHDLEQSLHKLVKAGLLAYGSSHFCVQGSDDEIFAMFFRDYYGDEVEHVKMELLIGARIEQHLEAYAAAAAWRRGQAKAKNLPAILRENPGATLHFDQEADYWYLMEFPKEPPPDNPDEEIAWLRRYILAEVHDVFENPDHARYPEGVLRAALECLGIGFEPDKSRYLTSPDRVKWLSEN